MADYKVRISDKVYRVAGFAALVELAKSGRLGPKDPVFVPRTGKWHYASSIRQLREHFAEVGTPAVPSAQPPSPAPVEDSSRVARPDFTPSRPVDPSGSSAQQARAEVLPLRRPEPAGDPIEVQVYAYEVDAETPPWFRRAALFGAVGIFSVALLVAVVVIQEQGQEVSEVGYEPVAKITRNTRVMIPVEDVPTPEPAPTRRRNKDKTGKQTRAAATPRPAVEIAVLRTQVKRLPGGKPKSIDALTNQITQDLTRMKVPVREVTIRPARTKKKLKVVPYIVVVTYGHTAADGPRRRAAIGLVVGRAMSLTGLNVGAVQLKGHRGGKVVHKRRIAGPHVKQFYQGGSLGKFEARLKK